jgi:hypothetical protein
VTSSEASVPVVPENLRPGHFGVLLLGRVAMGDNAATLADLCVRGLLTIEPVASADGGDWWTITSEPTRATSSPAGSGASSASSGTSFPDRDPRVCRMG